MEQLGSALHRYFAPHRHSALLLAIIAAFATRAVIGDDKIATAVFSVAIVSLLLVALYNINIDELVGERGRLLIQARRRRMLGWMLAAMAGAERIVVLFEHSPTLNLIGSTCWLLFAVFITSSQLRSVLRQRSVTGETICMAVSVYLLIGLCWTFVYAIIFQRHPESFAGIVNAHSAGAVDFQHFFPILGYFSLTTLSTVGFGDITPTTLQARYAAVAEGIAGQFYLAILVARLVGLQMSQAVVTPESKKP